MLGPQHFVELAESSGTMRALTATVLDLALAQTRRWHDDGMPLTVAVNVSPSDLIDQSFPGHVEQRLAAHDVPSGALVVEITENHVMEDRPRATTILEQLRRLGVGIPVDDFGTGYSSLAYLAELPVTEVKLDRAFVEPMLKSARASSIVHFTVQPPPRSTSSSSPRASRTSPRSPRSRDSAARRPRASTSGARPRRTPSSRRSPRSRISRCSAERPDGGGRRRPARPAGV